MIRANCYLRKEAGKLVRSFLLDGYCVLVSADSFISLRHCSNGNTIQLRLSENNCIHLYKNHNFVKTYEYNKSLH